MLLTNTEKIRNPNVEGVELNGPGDLAKYLFDTSVKELLQQSESQRRSPEIVESTLYVGKEELRFDTTLHMMGKMSYLMCLSQERIYSIFWDRKQYIEMMFAEIQQMPAKS